MLELVRRELVKEGVSEVNFFSYNFEDWTISNLCEATALHDDVCKRVQGVDGKAFFSMKSKKYWKGRRLSTP